MSARTLPLAKPRAAVGDLRRTMRLFRRFMGSPGVYIGGVVLLVIEAATAIVEPYPIAYLIDFLQGARASLPDEFGIPAVLPSERLGTILVLTVAIIGIAAINSAADSLTEVCMARGGRSLGYRIRVAMYSHLQRLPLAYHDRRRTGDVLTRVTGDVLVVEDFVVLSVSNILGALLVLVGSFVVLFAQSWSVASVALVVVPMLALISNFFSQRIKSASKTQRAREGELASTTQEMLTSIRLVQSYGRGQVDLDRFANQTDQSMRASLSAANIQAQFSFVVALVEAIAICAVIWLGVWLVDRSAITIGTLVLFVLLLRNMFKPARKIVSEWYKVGKVVASVERIDDLLERDVGVSDLPDARPAPPLEGRLTFRNVSFAYPLQHEDGLASAARHLVLDRINFEVAPGEVVALVGRSGAGKSTIAQLVPRLYDADEGEVLVDGLPVRSLTLASLRSQVSLVLQETMLLSGTVAENIGYGVADASRPEIEAAARLANAHDFISALPDGYDTSLGERGLTLSGGQRQRLAIARAFIRRAPILILDEPTTGLDQESSAVVVDALRTLMRGKTAIVISHDPDLIRAADRSLVIADGRVVGQDETPGRGKPPGTRHGGGGRDRPRRSPRPVSERLIDRLCARLPAMRSALDVDAMGERIGLMLRGGVAVERLDSGSYWVRTKDECSLRYAVTLSDGTAHTVLLRVHRGPAAARRYFERSVRPLARRFPPIKAGPWRVGADVDLAARVVLSVFPVDPTLPTLAQALDPAVVGRRASARLGLAKDPRVSLVHYPREGACVVRYDFGPGDRGKRDARARTLFGKVYGGGSALVVEGFLAALAHGGLRPVSAAARYPEPVLFEPTLKLLVTSAVPGIPLVQRLRARVSDSPKGDGGDLETLRADVAASGRALATLHQSDLATAPVHSAAAEIEELRHHLTIVDRAGLVTTALREHVDRLAADAPEASDMVLSHGDFTPSQVLVDCGKPGIVDFDSLCWADAARDIGRFLAQLELIAVAARGEAGRALTAELATAFVDAYAIASRGVGRDVPDADRIDFYRHASLARTALRACRQLKDRRLELASSLLDSPSPIPMRRTVP